MIGRLKIFLIVTVPGFRDWDSGDVKRVCITQKSMLREDCEDYVRQFREANRFQKHEIYALWTTTDTVEF